MPMSMIYPLFKQYVCSHDSNRHSFTTTTQLVWEIMCKMNFQLLTNNLMSVFTMTSPSCRPCKTSTYFQPNQMQISSQPLYVLPLLIINAFNWVFLRWMSKECSKTILRSTRGSRSNGENAVGKNSPEYRNHVLSAYLNIRNPLVLSH